MGFRIKQSISLIVFLIFISYPCNNLFSFNLIDRNLLKGQNQFGKSDNNIFKNYIDLKSQPEYKLELSPRKALWLELVPLVLASSGAAVDQIIKGSTCYQKWIDTTIDGDKVRLMGEYKCDLTWEYWYPISLMFFSIPGHFYVEDSAKKTGLLFLAKAISFGAITGITALSSIRDPDTESDHNNSDDFLIGLYFGSLTVIGIYIYEMIDVYSSAKIENLEINKQQGLFIQPLAWKGEYRFNVGYSFY